MSEDRKIQPGLGIGEPKLDDSYQEWLRPMLMSQRRALLMQVEAVEKLLGIAPTTADLRKQAKSDRMSNEQ